MKIKLPVPLVTCVDGGDAGDTGAAGVVGVMSGDGGCSDSGVAAVIMTGGGGM